jgi:site-specific recombinase XerD
MRSTNTFGITFYIKKYKAKNDKAPVYARITVDGKRLDISTKQEVSISNWNSAKGLAKGSREEIKLLNNHLEQMRARIVESYQELLLQKKSITVEAIKNIFCGEQNEEHSLLKVFDYHNETVKVSLEWGTLKNYFTTQKYVVFFLKEKLKRNDILLSELSYKFISDFELYLRTRNPLDYHKKCENNTVMKHIERLRKIVNMAIKNEWIEKDPFAKFKASFTRTSRGFLSMEEVNVISNKNFQIPRLQYAKDLFVFSCYTGLAYIDVMRLTPQSLCIGIDGNQWITTSRKKTDQPVMIPLLLKAKELIDIYRQNLIALSKNTLFPVISNQKLNSYLKEIADLCRITKNLTFHLARHTFATTITLTNGVPIETVSKMLGHANLRTTQIYAKVIEKKVSNDMMALQEKLAENQMTLQKSMVR